MKEFHVFVAFLGVGLGVAIFWLIRRDHLYLRQGLFWIVVALASLVLGVWPGVIDRVGAWAGIAYPPALLLLVAVVVLLVRALLTDIALTQVRRDVRRLNQCIALADIEHRPPER